MVKDRERGTKGEEKEDGRGWWKSRDKRWVTGREQGDEVEGKNGGRETRKAGIKDW